MSLLAALALLAAGCGGGDGKKAAAPRWPGPGNTAVPAGAALAPLDGATTLLATPSEVVDGKDVTGRLTVTASNATLRFLRVRGCSREPVISVDYGVHDLQEGEDSHNDAVLTNGRRNRAVRQTAVIALNGCSVDGGHVAGKPFSDGFDPGRPANAWVGNVWHDSGLL
jgi:hypothetical protein